MPAYIVTAEIYNQPAVRYITLELAEPDSFNAEEHMESEFHAALCLMTDSDVENLAYKITEWYEL